MVVAFVQQLKPHNMFRKVIRNYAWDNIYHEKLLPLLERIIGPYRQPDQWAFKGC